MLHQAFILKAIRFKPIALEQRIAIVFWIKLLTAPLLHKVVSWHTVPSLDWNLLIRSKIIFSSLPFNSCDTLTLHAVGAATVCFFKEKGEPETNAVGKDDLVREICVLFSVLDDRFLELPVHTHPVYFQHAFESILVHSQEAQKVRLIMLLYDLEVIVTLVSHELSLRFELKPRTE